VSERRLGESSIMSSWLGSSAADGWQRWWCGCVAEASPPPPPPPRKNVTWHGGASFRSKVCCGCCCCDLGRCWSSSSSSSWRLSRSSIDTVIIMVSWSPALWPPDPMSSDMMTSALAEDADRHGSEKSGDPSAYGLGTMPCGSVDPLADAKAPPFEPKASKDDDKKGGADVDGVGCRAFTISDVRTVVLGRVAASYKTRGALGLCWRSRCWIVFGCACCWPGCC